MNSGKKIKNVLIGCTGSVASLKLPVLVDLLNKSHDVQISVVVTENAKHFFSIDDLTSVTVYTDSDEWDSWNKRGDPVIHIELTKWADIFVIAPLDANTLAKIANGICDNILTCIVRAWNTEKPLLFCPAMNTKMWNHPITTVQITTLQSWGYTMVPCISKTLICGDTGLGAMAEVDTIAEMISNKLKDVEKK